MLKWKWIFLTLVFLLVSFFLFILLSICFYAEVDETRRADVAIVLGAAVYAGEPSPVYKERINHAVLLYEGGMVDKIILTGGVSAGNARSDAAVAMLYAVYAGVPAADIFLEERSSITQENLLYAKEVMREHGLSTALIISDPLHMKRAMLLAKDAGIHGFSSPTKTSMYVSVQTKTPFLMREAFFYAGYLFYRIFY